MKLFLSWSGSPSKELATTFRAWLESTPLRVDAFMSEVDIESGERSIQVIQDELEQTNFGLVFLTPGNLNSNWIHFEAGALAKVARQSRVVPILFNVTFSDLHGPLASFHARYFDRASMHKLLSDINREAETPASEKAIGDNFRISWRGLSKSVSTILTKAGHRGILKESPQQELLRHVRYLSARSYEQSVSNKDPLEGPLNHMNFRLGQIDLALEELVPKHREARRIWVRVPDHILDEIASKDAKAVMRSIKTDGRRTSRSSCSAQRWRETAARNNWSYDSLWVDWLRASAETREILRQYADIEAENIRHM
jgi:hypothetical protein